MRTIIHWNQKIFQVDLSIGHDISIPMHSGKLNPGAFHIPYPRFEPIQIGNYIGSVEKGSGANCENLFINAHGNGTHTECIGHITRERISINSSLKSFHFMAQLVTLEPTRTESGDWVVMSKEIADKLESGIDALIVRTLPNSDQKLTQNYSGENPCYLSPGFTRILADKNISHLLVDLPSVDREEDNGEMLAHKAFWQYPENPRVFATISEMIFVPNLLTDGIYLLNIQIASLETDASPSKPVIYDLLELKT